MPVITIRTKRPKSELSRAANGNINRWINSLIDEAIEPATASWREHFKKNRMRVNIDDVLEMRKSER
jgi:hypothetical protein